MKEILIDNIRYNAVEVDDFEQENTVEHVEMLYSQVTHWMSFVTKKEEGLEKGKIYPFYLEPIRKEDHVVETVDGKYGVYHLMFEGLLLIEKTEGDDM
ncbi:MULTISPECIES: hypothetical protein [Bacillus]|uniref:Uncharacterized protein n=2 Tax=Bacillus thuringiensis TaxID=1428 RepID=A0AAP4V2C4_BACTU|nr:MULTISPECIES: hypothetical protein [Bacillus]MEC0045762.1 hypothetical protein [Bacillus cereus]AFV22014.1 hypothetical protein BTB_502p07090 [Bacillus thuringiensis Bt407]EEM24965.1 hypothetical protein bthur0002_56070 [Bacillus thuringiensis Bt407]ERI00808.1 hypothetical protein BTCBT_002363 [Bacillus thuringiensis T01-328]MBN6707589.1 hypothetical protein [Bacillus thuringiensis]